MPHRPFFCFQSALFIPPRPLHSRAIVCPWNPVGPLYSRRPLHFGQTGRLLRANFTAGARRPARGRPGRCWAGGPSTSCSLIDNDILYSSSCHYIDFCWRFSSVDGTYIYSRFRQPTKILSRIRRAKPCREKPEYYRPTQTTVCL